MNRKHYIDNIRSITTVLVLIYHIIYSFNTVGIVNNLGDYGLGIPAMEVISYALYPWFMVLLFLLAGISARYSLAKRGAKAFLKERFVRLIVPFVGGIFILGWINGWITNHAAVGGNMFGPEGALLPGIVKYIVYSLVGMGALWFLLELFIASLLLLLIKRFDANDSLYKACGKLFQGRMGLSLAALLVLPVWGFSYLFNVPVLSFFRGIYLFVFLLGYYVFSQDDLLDQLKQPWTIGLALVAAVASGVLFVRTYYGMDYTQASVLQHPLTNAFTWFTCLAFLSCGQLWLDGSGKLSQFFKKYSFGIYVFHYPFLTGIAYLLITYVPSLTNPLLYLVLLIVVLPLCIIATAILSKIPILKTLLLGITKNKA